MTTTTDSICNVTVQGNAVVVEGTGLITGLPVKATISPAPAGTGVVFEVAEGIHIPARLEAVVHTDRGVTLAHPSGKTLSIVEHFLSGVAMAGLSDLFVKVEGGPELPLLDGSAQIWVEHLVRNLKPEPLTPEKADVALPEGSSVYYKHSDEVNIYAIPSPHLKITYALNYPEHPDIHHRWARWDFATDGVEKLAPARTWGFLSELPALQAQGLARGVSLENTLGLTDDGGYTTPLRMEDEPLYHKMLDLIGDLMLTGLNPLRLKAHIFAVNAGHGSHTRFGQELKSSLKQWGQWPDSIQ